MDNVDLGIDWISTPDNQQICFTDLPGIYASLLPSPHQPARIRQPHTDRRVLPGIAHHMPKSLNSIPLNPTHRTSVKIGPDALRPMCFSSLLEGCHRQIQRFFPGNLLKRTNSCSLGSNSLQWMGQPIWMMMPLCIIGNLAANHSIRVRMLFPTSKSLDLVVIITLHLKCTGTWTIMRTSTVQPL